MTEEIQIRAALDATEAVRGLQSLGGAFRRATTGALAAQLTAVNAALGRLATNLDESTEGFDRFRGAIDAQGDRLRLFGTTARGVADAIDEISDPAQRVALFQAEMNRQMNPDLIGRTATRLADFQAEASVAAARLGPLLPLLGGVAAGFAAVGAAAASYAADAGAKYWQTQGGLVEISAELERQQARLALAVGEAAVKMTGAEQSAKRLSAATELLAIGAEGVNKSTEDYSGAVNTLKVGIGVLLPPIGSTILAYEGLAAAGDKAVEMTQGQRKAQEDLAEARAVLIQQLELELVRLDESKSAVLAEMQAGHLSTAEKQARIHALNELVAKERLARDALAQVPKVASPARTALQALAADLLRVRDGFDLAQSAAQKFMRGLASLENLLPKKKTGGGGGGGKQAPPWMGEASGALAMGAVGRGGTAGIPLSALAPSVGAGAQGIGAGGLPQGFSLAEQGQRLGEAWKNAVPAFQAAAQAQARIAQEGLRMDGLSATVQTLVSGFADLGGQVAETLGVFAAGGGTLKGFGDAMLDTFSGLAGKIGDYYIALGIAMTAALDPAGPAVVAGGLGLKAVAGFLGQKGSGNARGGRGGGGASRAAASDRIASLAPRDRNRTEAQSTTVNVIIDGDKVASQTQERARLGHLTLSPYAPRGARG